MTQRKPFAVVTDAGAVVPTSVLDQYAVKATSSSSRQLDTTDEKLAGQLIKPKYSPATLASALELNTWHARACTVKAQDVAGSGWRLQSTVDDPDQDQKALLEGWLDELPTPKGGDLHEAPLLNVFERCQLDFESVGYAALELVREDYDPAAPLATIAHLPSKTLRIAKDRKRFVQQRASGKRRWFKLPEAEVDVDYEHGIVRGLGELAPERRATEVLFWSNYNPNEETYGLPDHIPALGAIHGDLGRRDFNLSFFQNFGVPAFLITISGDFDPGEPVDDNGDPDPDGKTPLERTIEDHVRHLRDNPHSNLVLTIPSAGTGEDAGEIEVKFERLSTDVKEASFRLFRSDNATEVLAAHGVPAARVGSFQAGAANREASEVYKRSVIDPRQRTIIALVNRYIIRGGLGITDWRFDLIELDNRDESHDVDVLTKLHAVGAVSSQEIRGYFAARFGLDPETAPADDTTVTDVRDTANQVREIAAELARGRRLDVAS